MANPQGFIPDDQFEPATTDAITPDQANSSEGFIPDDQFVSQEDQYNTLGELLKTATEGVASGIITKPVTRFIENKLLDVPSKDIKGREEASPILHGASEAAGLVGSAFLPGGQAKLLSEVGEGATLAAGLGKVAEASRSLQEARSALKAANAAQDISQIGQATQALAGAKEAYSAIPASQKIGAEAISQAAQMAAYQAGDDVSKMIINDPDASAQTAITNVGLAAVLGGTAGAALGAISPLWKATAGKKLGPLVEDIKSRFNFRLNNPNLAEAAGKEMQDLHTNISNTIEKLYSEGVEGGGVRADQISKAMPELSEANTARINAQLQKVSDNVTSAIESMSNDVKVKSKVPYVSQDLEAFQEIIANPQASYIDKFNALDDLKKVMQGYSKYGMSVDDTAFGAITKNMAAKIRPVLEDTEVWGKAGAIQQDLNKAISEFIPTQKDVISRFTTKLAGEKVIDPSKINTYINQIGKPSAEIKQEMVKNYLDKSEKLINTINNIFEKQGMEGPFPHSASTILRDTLGERTAGSRLVDTLIDKQLANIVGRTGGGIAGTLAGGALGHPYVGLLIGEHALGPFLSSVMPALNKPLLENPSSVQGLKSAIDYASNVAKGDALLNKSVKNVFRSSIPILPDHKIPNEMSRAKLDRLVADRQDKPQEQFEIANSHIGHYLPNHQVSVAQTSTQALQYLQQLKPKDYQPSPLDRPIKPTAAQEARYNRALDIAQQPAIVLQHLKNGTLQQSDIQDISHMYPALYKSMVQKVSNQMISHHSDEEPIPYKTKMGISLFVGQAIDSTMLPANIIAAQPKPPQQPMAPQTGQKSGQKVNAQGGNALKKLSNSYKTPGQSAESARASRESN